MLARHADLLSSNNRQDRPNDIAGEDSVPRGWQSGSRTPRSGGLLSPRYCSGIWPCRAVAKGTSVMIKLWREAWGFPVRVKGLCPAPGLGLFPRGGDRVLV
jgi:hypothetical protein